MALTEHQGLIEQLEQLLQHHEIHAVYEPDEGEPLPDCYMAAVDLFEPGQTYRVYFRLDAEGDIEIVHLERWYFG